MKTVVLHQRTRKKKSRIWKGVFVVLIASGLSTLAIYASDSFRVPGNSILAGVGGSGPVSHCPDDMVYIPASGGGFCIDYYEASPGKTCPNQKPANQFETKSNLASPLCVPVSVPDADPWVNVPEHEALALCAKAGKRLPSNSEWYRAALGTPDDVNGMGSTCSLDHVGQTGADKTGAHSGCVSSYGAFDMIGNVWEWVDGTTADGKYDGRVLPGEGFVSEVDADGVPTKVGTSSQSFGNDYFYVDPVGVKGMFRGGFWSMGEKAGMYGMNAANPTTFVGNAVGFRCAREAR